MKNWLRCFRRNRSAATGLEYALFGALISVIIVGAMSAVGTQLTQLYEFIKDQFVLAIK